MTDARFHRVAILAEVSPATLRGFLCGFRQTADAIDRIVLALAWVDADDARRERVAP